MKLLDYLGMAIGSFALSSIGIFLYSCAAYTWQVPNWMSFAWPILAVLAIITYFISKRIEKTKAR